MPNKRIRQWMKASNMLEKHDPTMIATLNSDDPNKAYPCMIFRKSELPALKAQYGKRLVIISEYQEEQDAES